MKAQKKILIIEDDNAMRMALEQGLLPEGYLVESASDGAEGLHLALTCGADLVLLDLMLPKMDGFEILRRIREDQLEIPVVILTARGEEEERIQGFEYGADDYVVKPFSVRELLLRVNAVLRRTADSDGGPTKAMIQVGEAEIDFKTYQIRKGGKRFSLSRKEADMLRLLFANPNQVVTRQQFLESVWGYQTYPTTRTVDTHVLNLRQKIETDPNTPVHLLTVHGVGYMFVP